MNIWLWVKAMEWSKSLITSNFYLPAKSDGGKIVYGSE
jgi:hypothetical protein